MNKIVVYGLGGYDESKPNNNIIEETELPDEPVDPIQEERENAKAKLFALGLTESEINALLGV